MDVQRNSYSYSYLFFSSLLQGLFLLNSSYVWVRGLTRLIFRMVLDGQKKNVHRCWLLYGIVAIRCFMLFLGGFAGSQVGGKSGWKGWDAFLGISSADSDLNSLSVVLCFSHFSGQTKGGVCLWWMCALLFASITSIVTNYNE